MREGRWAMDVHHFTSLDIHMLHMDLMLEVGSVHIHMIHIDTMIK